MASSKNKFEVVFENDEFIAINKPAGMLSIPDRQRMDPRVVAKEAPPAAEATSVKRGRPAKTKAVADATQ